MQNFFLESPAWLGVCGMFVAVVAGYFWTQTGNRIAGYTAIGLAVLTLLLVMISIQIDTPREQIRQMLSTVAKKLESNDHAAVQSFIHPQATETVQRAKTELPQYVFSQAKITRIRRILINESASPRSAVAEFNVVVALEYRGQNARVPRFVKVYLVEQDGRWLARDFEHFEPTKGFKDPSLDGPSQGNGTLSPIG